MLRVLMYLCSDSRINNRYWSFVISLSAQNMQVKERLAHTITKLQQIKERKRLRMVYCFHIKWT